MHLSHGARSPRVYGELAEHLAAGLLADRPDLADYPEAVAAWATTEAQVALLRRHIAQTGPLTSEGEPVSALGWLHRMEGAAAKHRARLGLDPFSEAALARERATATAVAVDLAAIAERGRQAIASREAAGLPAPPDVAGEVLARVQGESRTTWDRAVAEHHAVEEASR